MLHRAEAILAWVKAQLEGLTTTGDAVYRGRVYPVPLAKGAALKISLGPDLNPQRIGNAYIDSELTVRITVHIKTADEEVDVTALRVRGEVHQKLMSVWGSRPAGVIDFQEADVSEPVYVESGEAPALEMTIAWEFQYRRGLNDPSVTP